MAEMRTKTICQSYTSTHNDQLQSKCPCSHLPNRLRLPSGSVESSHPPLVSGYLRYVSVPCPSGSNGEVSTVKPVQAQRILIKCSAERIGKITKDEAFALLDAFVDAGGNFIGQCCSPHLDIWPVAYCHSSLHADTANLYHFGDSERWIGEWMEARGNRDKMVIATKYSGWNDGTEQDINSMGNHIKSMHLTVRDSLKRLRTSCEWIRPYRCVSADAQACNLLSPDRHRVSITVRRLSIVVALTSISCDVASSMSTSCESFGSISPSYYT